MNIRYKYDNIQPEKHNDNTLILKIEWSVVDHFVYLIEPKSVAQRDDLQKSMHNMYEKEILCDLNIFAKDGTVKAHSIPFFTYGGEMIQKMLTSNMKESLEKTIYFKEFSLRTVRAFIGFVYLGQKALEPEVFVAKNIDLNELFQMAQTYQNLSLIDCCTNLYSIFSKVEDIKIIKHLADIYNNEHLLKLYEALHLKINSNASGYIKV